VDGGDDGNTRKIGDRARDFQHPLPGPSRESETFHRSGKQPLSDLIRPAPALHGRIAKPRVASTLALELQRACAGDALRGRCRGFDVLARGHGELVCREARYVDLHVESVQQRR
jgi:hypothetical protein